MSLVHEGDHIWGRLQHKEATSNPAVHREQEVAQTLLGTGQTIWLGEKKSRLLS